MFDQEEIKCSKCGCKIYGLGDDYNCPLCHGTFCYDHIDKHGCNVESYTVGNKTNYVRIKE